MIGKKSALILLLPAATLFGGKISYSVDFEGAEDAKMLKALRSSSQLVTLKKKPPSSINALRFRAESDCSDLVKVLKSLGYFEAKVDFQIQEDMRNIEVIIHVYPGPLYRIDYFHIELPEGVVCHFKNLGIAIGDPADHRQILDGELCALQLLAECGYPLAAVRKREIVADGATKRVRVTLAIDPGPLAYFGATSIEGNCSVRTCLIEQQIRWLPGQQYNSCLVEETQKALIDTGLFTSVYITHPKALDSDTLLPMKIEVAEAKHKSVSVGASYQTTFGPGVTFGWENRNVGGLGRRLLLQADIAQRSHSGIASYLIPNFHRIGQNYIIQGQAWHESITAYKTQSYSFLNRFERQVNPEFYFNVGPKVEYMMVSNSVDNGNFLLVEGPIYLRWTNVKDVLNPISGFRFEYNGVPAINIKDASDIYYSQIITVCSYIPLWKDDFLILAQKWTLGTIFSNGIGAIPVPKRLFGGSEENLRGYKYYTVSPLNDDDKPIGGRSAIYYSLEPRFRLSESFGLVPFFDMGNVYLESLPTFKGKWRKSAGIGIRYFSFLGPLRLDVAFPLNRRPGIDPRWWVFVSVGQAF